MRRAAGRADAFAAATLPFLRFLSGEEEVHGAVTQYGRQDGEDDSQQRIQVETLVAPAPMLEEVSQMSCLGIHANPPFVSVHKDTLRLGGIVSSAFVKLEIIAYIFHWCICMKWML